jgi:hypothetical protein
MLMFDVFEINLFLRPSQRTRGGPVDRSGKPRDQTEISRKNDGTTSRSGLLRGERSPRRSLAQPHSGGKGSRFSLCY